MKFKEFLKESIKLNENVKEETKSIREFLKDKYRLTSRDVSVKFDVSGSSSEIKLKIKTDKGLLLYNELNNLVKDFETVSVDKYGGVLSGGNTFVDVDFDYKYETNITNRIKDEFKSLTKKGFAEDDSVVLFDTFVIEYYNENSISCRVKGKSGTTSSMNVKNDNVEGILFTLIMKTIKKSKDDSLYSKIK